jgi:hypothetical protein
MSSIKIDITFSNAEFNPGCSRSKAPDDGAILLSASCHEIGINAHGA